MPNLNNFDAKLLAARIDVRHSHRVMEQRVTRFLKALVRLSGLDVSVHGDAEGETSVGTVKMRLEGPDVPLLIADRGALLGAMEHLASETLQAAQDGWVLRCTAGGTSTNPAVPEQKVHAAAAGTKDQNLLVSAIH